MQKFQRNEKIILIPHPYGTCGYRGCIGLPTDEFTGKIAKVSWVNQINNADYPDIDFNVYTFRRFATEGTEHYHDEYCDYSDDECEIEYDEEPETYEYSACMLESLTAQASEEVSTITAKKAEHLTKIPYKQFKLGIELETTIPYENIDALNEQIELAGIPITHTGDGSIETHGEMEGEEYKGTRPMSYSELKKTTKKLTDLFLENEVGVNTSCGFHLHVSHKKFTNQQTLNRIIMTWSAIEDFLLATQPRSRMNNTYCQRYLLQYVNDQKSNKKLARGKQKLIQQMRGIDRYRTMNLAALAAHGTIEIRLHAGTTNYKKIMNWVDLILTFFSYCLNEYDHKEVYKLFLTEISDQKVEDTMELLGLPDKQRSYFRARIKKMLFATLAKQQNAAGKIIKNIKTIKKAQESYARAQKRVSRLNSAYEQEYRILQYPNN